MTLAKHHGMGDFLVAKKPVLMAGLTKGPGHPYTIDYA